MGVLPKVDNTETTGVFGSFSYEIIRGLRLNVEARRQYDRVQQIVFSPGGVNLASTFPSFTPRVIVEYKPRESITTYISYAEGVRPGEFNGALYSRTPAQRQQVINEGINAPLALGEEHIDMYEAGLKGEFLDRRLRFLGAVYTGKWSDRHIAQTALIDLGMGGPLTGFNVQTPGGLVNLSGVELQATAVPMKGLTFEGTFDYAGSDIRVSSCSDCLALTGITNNVGNRLPRYPAFTGSFSATYERTVLSLYNGYVRGDLIYTGRRYDTESDLAWTAPSAIVNLRAGIERNNITFELFGNNVFDDKTPLTVARSTETYTPTANILIYAPPNCATYGGRVLFKF